MADIIMFSTDDHNHHNKVVLVKLGNPIRNQIAEMVFRENTQTHESYQGAVVIADDDEALRLYDMWTNGGLNVTWL